MPRALMWLNLYGCEAVRYKLKNGMGDSFNNLVFRAYLKTILRPLDIPPILTAIRVPVYANSMAFFLSFFASRNFHLLCLIYSLVFLLISNLKSLKII